MRPPDPIVIPRRTLGAASAAVAGLFLAVGGYCLYRGLDLGGAPDPTPSAAPSIDPMTGEPVAPFRPPVPNQIEFALAGLTGLLCALTAGGCAFWAYARLPAADPARAQADDRLALLAFGGAFGFILTLLGTALFYLWFADLTAWLNREEKPKVWKPLTALLVYLAGAVTAFLAAQPARGDERNAPGVRRAVYGVNLGLSGVLVFALLVVLNIAVALKLPARFDTSEGGMYTLSDSSRDYLRQLNQDLAIYSTMPEEDRGADVARLLGSIREANPQRIRVKRLSQDLDKTEIANLKAKFKTTDLINPADNTMRFGLLVAAGPDEAKASFIGAETLFARTGGQRGAPGRLQFQGESRILREILFLTESRTKSVIYFTQGAGEIAIDRGTETPGAAPVTRLGERLKTNLAGDRSDVLPLRFDPAAGEPKVPDDATIVIVADPLTTISEGTQNALRRFMRTKKPDGTFGKLVVMAGAHPQPGGTGLLKTGLDDLLGDFGIVMPPQALYAQPTRQRDPTEVQVGVNPGLAREGNPIALAYNDLAFSVANARPVMIRGQGEGGAKVEGLLFTIEDRTTWYESSVSPNPIQTYLALRDAREKGNVGYLQARDMRAVNRPVGLIASEPASDGKMTNRLAVFGFGAFFEDATDARAGQAELLGTVVNWIRDRPAVANDANKPYGVYEPNKAMKWNQVFTLPVAGTLIGLATLGVGLWAWRRK